MMMMMMMMMMKMAMVTTTIGTGRIYACARKRTTHHRGSVSEVQ